MFAILAGIPEKPIKISFWSLDLLVGLYSVGMIFVSIFDQTVWENGYGVLYDINTCLNGTSSMITALVYCVFGFYITVKINKYYKFCSKQTITFLVVSLTVCVGSLLRFVGLFFKFLFPN